MNVLFDTSAVIALVVKGHPQHSSANKTYNNLVNQKAALFLASHSIAELYRTLTWGKAYLNYSAKQAAQLLKTTVTPQFTTVDLSAAHYLEVVDSIVDADLTGAIIYDALISKAATLVEAKYLVTFNAKDFQRVFPENGADLIIPR